MLGSPCAKLFFKKYLTFYGIYEQIDRTNLKNIFFCAFFPCYVTLKKVTNKMHKLNRNKKTAEI